ncbi:hypothetical protein BV898_13396 [Hypsibius exemplaris]|uniref:Receptor ligand binding region domain-containing protein n=1 Tax=Hypsibius exemplaris TaxID=2072580 RepID=A0A1W0WB15_HYPEX|nr:hypothetical protein BV898_13396 [Hypsibius exemplaris]
MFLRLILFSVINFCARIVFAEKNDANDGIEIWIGSFGTSAPASQPYSSEAAYRMAVDDLASRINHTFTFKLSFLYGRPATTIQLDCQYRSDDADYVLSQWYYGRQALSLSQPSLTGLIQDGCFDGSTIHSLAAQWNILSLTSVASQRDPKDTINSGPTSFFLGSVSIAAYVRALMTFFKRFNFDSVYLLLDIMSPGVYGGVFDEISITSEANRPRNLIKTRVAITESTPLTPFLLIFTRISRASSNSSGLGYEQVYLAVEPMQAPQRFGLMDWRYNLSDDEQARRAYRSLLVIQPLTLGSVENNHSTTKLTEFQDRLSRYNTTRPNDMTEISRDCYATAMLFGQIMMESHDNGMALTDGQAMAKKMRNRTFHLGDYVGDIFIDSYGQRTPDVLIAHFEGRSTTPKASFVLLANSSVSGLRQIYAVEWSDKTLWPPPNQPLCGYNGEAYCGLASKFLNGFHSNYS